MRVRWVLGCAVGAVAAAALGATPPASPTLAGRTFVATEFVYGGEAKPIWAMGALPLRFERDGRGFSGSVGCNDIAGTYQLAGGKWVLETGGWTQAGCSIGGLGPPVPRAPRYGMPPDRFYLDVAPELDDPLGAFLSAEPAIRIGPSTVTLSSVRGHLVLQQTFDPRALAARELREVRAVLRDPRWLN